MMISQQVNLRKRVDSNGMGAMDVARALGFADNLILCLDAGHEDSWDSVVDSTKWRDLSGNGYDFFLGAAASVDGDEPGFDAGATIGALSGTEYFNMDGTEFFQYDTTNETWMDDLHKNNASLATLIVFQPTSTNWTGGRKLFGTTDGNTSFSGYGLRSLGTQNIDVYVTNAVPGVALDAGASSVHANDLWNVTVHSIGEAVPQHLRTNGALTQDGASASYSSPSAAAASNTLKVGSAVNSHMHGDIAMCIHWDLAFTTTSQLLCITEAMGGRYNFDRRS